MSSSELFSTSTRNSTLLPGSSTEVGLAVLDTVMLEGISVMVTLAWATASTGRFNWSVAAAVTRVGDDFARRPAHRFGETDRRQTPPHPEIDGQDAVHLAAQVAVDIVHQAGYIQFQVGVDGLRGVHQQQRVGHVTARFGQFGG